jgi:hypothetical protein
MNEFQGRPLAALLQAKMKRDDLSLEQLGNRLFVGGSYLSQLLRGVKRINAASDVFLRASAEYLCMPVVTAHLLAGKLRAEDFFDVQQPDWGECLNKALRTVGESRVAANAAVTEAMLREMPSEVKLLLVLLFEEATATVVLPKRVSVSDISNFGKACVPFDVRHHSSN